MEDDLEKTLQLVRNAKAGDREALDKLFSRYLDRVHLAVRVRLGSKLREKLESQDIVQDALLRGFKSFDKFEMVHEGAFLHWLTKLVENTIRDKADYFAAQKRSVREAAPLPDDGSSSQGAAIDGLKGNDPTPSAVVVRSEQMARLEKALAQLNPDYQEIVVQREIEGLSFNEIGDNLGRSEDAARMLFVRAKAALAKALTEIK